MSHVYYSCPRHLELGAHYIKKFTSVSVKIMELSFGFSLSPIIRHLRVVNIYVYVFSLYGVCVQERERERLYIYASHFLRVCVWLCMFVGREAVS